MIYMTCDNPECDNSIAIERRDKDSAPMSPSDSDCNSTWLTKKIDGHWRDVCSLECGAALDKTLEVAKNG